MRLRFHPAEGVMHEVVGGIQSKLFLEVGAVDLDGFDAQMQLLGDVARALAAANQLEHLEFTVGESFVRGRAG